MEKKLRFLFARRGFVRQGRGIALVVILMLLVALTGVVAFSARQAVVGESSARNQMDYELARQAAEAALRDGERDILLDAKPSGAKCARESYDYAERFSPRLVNADCLQGQCSEQQAGTRNWSSGAMADAERWWPPANGGSWNGSDRSGDHSFVVPSDCVFSGGVPLGTFTGAARISQVEYQPEYLIELFLTRDTPMARVTARGFGMVKGQTQVVLQSYVRLPSQFP